MPLSPDDPLLIDQEARTLCKNPPWMQDAVTPDRLQLRKVAQEWVRQLNRVRERLLRKLMVGADPEQLDVQLPELTVVNHPGREIGHSRYLPHARPHRRTSTPYASSGNNLGHTV
jgi:hypothetical protein